VNAKAINKGKANFIIGVYSDNSRAFENGGREEVNLIGASSVFLYFVEPGESDNGNASCRKDSKILMLRTISYLTDASVPPVKLPSKGRS
jgi:hypothetical protein